MIFLFLVISIIVILLIVAAVIIYRQNMRKQMLRVLINLSRNYIQKVTMQSSTNEIFELYGNALATLEDAHKIARSEEEISRIQYYKKDLIDKRDKSIIRLNTVRISQLLNKMEKENIREAQLDCLMQARTIAKEGLVENAAHVLDGINHKLINLFLPEAKKTASALLKSGQKYEALKIYERALWQIFSTGIPDDELDQFEEIANAVKQIEIIESELDDSYSREAENA